MKITPPVKKILSYVETNIVSPNDIVPTVFGQEVCSGKKAPIRYDKSVYTIHFVLNGEGYVNGRLLKAGDAFLAVPHEGVSYAPNPSDPWTYLWFEFLGNNAEKYIKHSGFSNEVHCLHLNDLNAVVDVFSRIFREVPKHLNRHAKNMLYESFALQLFACITEECGYLERNKEKSFQLINYENILSYIENNYSNPNLTVASIAKEFSYAPSYLTRLFRKYGETPPCKYITKVRMEKAVELMDKQRYNINQISNIVGYQSQFYFSKAFLQYYGIRPSSYLKEKNN